MGSRRNIVDRQHLAELRTELNERLDIEKARGRAIHMVNLDHLSVCMGIGKGFESHHYLENSRKEKEIEENIC